MAKKPTRQDEEDEDNDEVENKSSPRHDTIIEGLLERLPTPGDAWPRADRDLWFEVLGKACQLIYPEQEEGGSAESS